MCVESVPWGEHAICLSRWFKRNLILLIISRMSEIRKNHMRLLLKSYKLSHLQKKPHKTAKKISYAWVQMSVNRNKRKIIFQIRKKKVPILAPIPKGQRKIAIRLSRNSTLGSCDPDQSRCQESALSLWSHWKVVQLGPRWELCWS